MKNIEKEDLPKIVYRQVKKTDRKISITDIVEGFTLNVDFEIKRADNKKIYNCPYLTQNADLGIFEIYETKEALAKSFEETCIKQVKDEKSKNGLIKNLDLNFMYKEDKNKGTLSVNGRIAYRPTDPMKLNVEWYT